MASANVFNSKVWLYNLNLGSTRLLTCTTPFNSSMLVATRSCIACKFFFSGMADVALWLGPSINRSRQNHLYKDSIGPIMQANQHTSTENQDPQPRRPANPPARFASRHEETANQTRNGARAQKATLTKMICHETQWPYHCVKLKNMPN